jgi:putative Mg2+ transporter-C (MgtC) family protein
MGAILGGVIGYERHRHGRPVGLRTHLIVALTAATFMVVSSQFVYYQHYRANDLVVVDSSRIAASVVSAIGFLAGGAILRTGVTVQGLTTGAGLWLVTSIGMSSGAGMYVVSAVVTFLGLIALTILRRFEDKQDNIVRRRLRVTLKPDGPTPEQFADSLRSVCLEVRVVSIELSASPERGSSLTLDVRLSLDVSVWQLVERAGALPGVEHVLIEVMS